MNFIDTADVYGLGHSEKLVATAIKGHRNDIILSTKGGLIGHHYDPNGVPVYDTPEKSSPYSKQVYNVFKQIILIFIFVIFGGIIVEKQKHFYAFDILKRDGKVRAVGVSTHDLQYIHHFNNNNEIDIVQLDYNILNRKPEKIYYHSYKRKI